MSDNSSQNDPSMKEILGSIRRIISEDNAQNSAEDAATDEEEETLELTDEVVEEEPEAGRHEPVLVATGAEAAESTDDEPEVRREPVLGLHSPETRVIAVEEQAPTEEESADAIPQEPPVLPDAGQLSPMPPELVRGPVPVPDDLPEDDEPMIDQEVSEVSETPVVPETESQPAPGISEESIEEIVSESATSAAASALGELTRAMDEKSNKLKVGSDEITISDMVKEMIRPMLREWLDQNLSGIVERVVRREIQKLVDRAETDD